MNIATCDPPSRTSGPAPLREEEVSGASTVRCNQIRTRNFKITYSLIKTFRAYLQVALTPLEGAGPPLIHNI